MTDLERDVLAYAEAMTATPPTVTDELSARLRERPRVRDSDAAYVCRGRVCDLPVTTVEDLAAALGPSV